MENIDTEKKADINKGFLDAALAKLKGKSLDEALDAYRSFANSHIGNKSDSTK